MNKTSQEDWHILIVDDDEEDYLITRAMLQQTRGRKVTLDWAGTYDTGQELINSRSYHAVLVDYDLGAKTGIEFIREARVGSCPVPLILFTGRGSYETDLEAMQAGATLYLTKSEANPLLLERFLRYAIERKRIEDELDHRLQERSDILESIQDGFFSLDRNWRITYANTRSAQIIGKQPKEMLGIQIWESFPGLLGTEVETHYRRSMEEGVSVQFETQGILRGVWYNVNVYPSAEGISVYWQDITDRKRAERDLQTRHALLSEAEEFSRTGTWEWDLSIGRWSFSRMWLSIHGTQPAFRPSLDELLKVVHPDDRQNVEQKLKDLIGGVRPVSLEYRINHQGTGEVRSLTGRAKFIRSTSGKVEKVYGFVHDNTQQRWLESALAQTRTAQQQQTVETELARKKTTLPAFESPHETIPALRTIELDTANSRDLILILDRKTSRILEASAAAVQAYGYSREQLLSMTFYDLHAPGAQTFIEEQLRQAEETGILFETRHRRKDGSICWVEVNTRSAVINNRHVLVSVVRDISERKHAEEKLRKSEHRFRSVVEANIFGVLFADVETGEITAANDEFLRIIGHTRQELEAGMLNWKTLTPPDVLEIEKQTQKDLKPGDFLQPYEKSYIRPDGSRVPVIIGGTFKGYNKRQAVAVVLDITRRKEAETALQAYADQLQRSNKALEDFAFIASHDLQEPLRKVLAFGNLLKTDYSQQLGVGGQDYIERIQGAAKRMQEMLEGLLSYSRVTTQGSPFSQVDMNQIARDVLYDLDVSLTQSGGTVTLEELPVIEADPVQMRQLLQNLIGNAIKFHLPGTPPRVIVSAEVNADNMALKVSDQGIGFEMRSAEQIFQPFRRLHSKSDYKGRGMGLAICKKIVERHSGSIEVISTPGKGSTFTITLPLKQKTPTPANAGNT